MTMTAKLSFRALGGALGAVLLATGTLAAEPAKPAQRTFTSPVAAADAIVSAAGTFDLPALKEILGSDGIDLVVTQDQVQDQNQAKAWAALARNKLVIASDPEDPNLVTLSVGSDDWPLPIPVVREGSAWRFDTVAGREEVFLRRIGRNELDAIEICRRFVQAQHEYAMEKRDGARVNQYAQHVLSTPNRQDGLAWHNADGTLGGPLAEEVARAIAEGYTERNQPYHGYLFKVLKGQGPSAPLGELDFVVQGAMIGGFALVAAPAGYEVTGVKTFIVGYDGVVYEQDLGPETLETFRAMERFDPDESWSPVKEPSEVK
jgi:hypothetical protein